MPTRLDLSNLELKTLQNLIAEATRLINLYPTLNNKLRLAYTLARSVLEFHLVRWLHRGLTSSNITFFTAKRPGQEQSLQEPYIVGFNHSRPNKISAFTTGPTEPSAKRYHYPASLNDS